MSRSRTLWVCLLWISLGGAALATAQSPVDRTAQLERLEFEFELADGPAWDGSGLYVPDVRGQQMFRYDPRTNRRVAVGSVGGRFSASYFNHGRLYVSDNGGSRIAIWGPDKLQTLVQLDAEAKPAQRPNDLVVDNAGGVYFTLTAAGRVMYATADGKLQTAVDGVDSPNGIILSPDEQTLYVASYVPKKIWAYPVSRPGVVESGRVLAAMDDGEAKGADGMCVDRAGNVYCAGATDVWIWSPGGRLLDKIVCPTRPINCAFGDPDLQTLYITGFGGLYRQKMLISGRSSQPASGAAGKAAGRRPSTEIPANIDSHLDVRYATVRLSDQPGDERHLLMDIFRRRDLSEAAPAVIVVHGGGWLKGDKTKFRALALALAGRGYVTAAIEYRLGGEALFPAAIHDCSAAVRFLRAEARSWGIDPERIGAVGGSAGGHLVGLMASGEGRGQLAGDGGAPDQSAEIQAAIVMAGPLQMLTGSVADRSRNVPQESNSNRWLGRTVDEAPELYRLADAYEHLSPSTPPMLFLCGELDHPERNEPSRERLRKLGVWTGLKVYADGRHGCWNQLPWFEDMVADMDQFFAQHLR